MRQQGQPFEFSKFIWFPSHCPKMPICLLRALRKKLPTLDKLCKIVVVQTTTCVLCQIFPETTRHLFFDCGYSNYIWTRCRLKLGLKSDFLWRNLAVIRSFLPWQNMQLQLVSGTYRKRETCEFSKTVWYVAQIWTLNHDVAQLTQLSRWEDGGDPKENDLVQNWACNINT